MAGGPEESYCDTDPRQLRGSRYIHDTAWTTRVPMQPSTSTAPAGSVSALVRQTSDAMRGGNVLLPPHAHWYFGALTLSSGGGELDVPTDADSKHRDHPQR